MLRDLFLGFIRVHILHHAALEAVYGAALLRELARHGYAVSPGTLYPILHDLEAAGFLTKTERIVGGKVRKYYAITEEGRGVLRDARGRIQELVNEVIENRGPERIGPETD